MIVDTDGTSQIKLSSVALSLGYGWTFNEIGCNLGITSTIPNEELEYLRSIEDQIDLREARAAREEADREGTTPLSEFKKELGL